MTDLRKATLLDLAYIARNDTFRLFRLGDEIRINARTVEEPQPPKKQSQFTADVSK